MGPDSLRRLAWMILALCVIGGCAVTPDMRPTYVRKLAEPPVQPFTSIALVFLPIRRPMERSAAAEYDRKWLAPEAWRLPFFRRLERNFAHNGISLAVFDAGVAGRTVIEPDRLQIRIGPQATISGDGGLGFAMRGEAENRGARYVAFTFEMILGRRPDQEADRQTYLILNALRDVGLIEPPAAGADYALAPR